MIPVVTVNNGEYGHQVMNDNLSTVEQINRLLLGTVAYTQTKLTNDNTALARKISIADVSEEKLEEVKAAAIAMHKAIATAMTEFDGVISKFLVVDDKGVIVAPDAEGEYKDTADVDNVEVDG